MTEFETELVRAIEHTSKKGCPICKDVNLFLEAEAPRGLLMITCGGCNSALYAHRWIPELTEIVKGE